MVSSQDVLAHLVQLHAAGADAGVGDDDVEPPELLDAAVDGGRQRVEVAHVDFRGDDAPIEVLDHVRGLGEVLRRGRGRGRVLEPAADVDRDDVGALLGKPHRVAAALAARGAGDERDLAVYPSGHGTSYPWTLVGRLPNIYADAMSSSRRGSGQGPDDGAKIVGP